MASNEAADGGIEMANLERSAERGQQVHRRPNPRPNRDGEISDYDLENIFAAIRGELLVSQYDDYPERTVLTFASVDNPFQAWTPAQARKIAVAFARAYKLADDDDRSKLRVFEKVCGDRSLLS